MKRKLLFIVLFFSLIFVSPTLAQDSELSETYISDNGELTVNHPAGWDIDDQDTDIYFHPAETEELEIVFRLLNELIQDTLGISHEMSAQEAMDTFADAIPEDAVLSEEAVLSDYGENSVATIEVNLGGYVLASVVETPGGLVMVQAIGTEDSVTAIRDLYFEMIATTLISLSDDSDEMVEESDSETIDLSETYVSINGELTVNHPAGWEIEDGNVNIFFYPDTDEVEYVFRLLTAEVQSSLGIHHGMTAEEGMRALVDGIPPDTGLSYESIVLADYGDNSVGTIEFMLGEDYTIASTVQTPGGSVMVQVIGTEEAVNLARDIYFEMITTTLITLPYEIEPLDETETDEDTNSDDEAPAEQVESIALDESFLDKASGLSFDYPDSWEADTNFGGFELIPPDDTFEELFVQFLIVDEEAEEQIGINADMGAEEAMQIIVDFDDEQNNLSYDDIVLANYGDNLVATVELEVSGEYYIASVVETSGGIVMIQVFGDEDEVNLARDIYFDIVASTNLISSSSSSSDTGILNEAYESDNDQLSFDYPDDWDIDDNDTSINLSHEDFEAIIEFEFWTEEIEETYGIPEDTRAGDAALAIAAFGEESGLDAEWNKTTIGDYPVANVVFTHPSDDITLISTFVQTDAGVILVLLEAPEDEFDDLTDIYEAMIASLDYHP